MSTDRRHTVTADATPVVYELALEIAAALDRQALDLHACTIRGCLDASDTRSRHQHLQVEMERLTQLPAIRASQLGPDIAAAVRRLQALTGVDHTPAQPLYVAMRDLVDHLELNGSGRWVQRLRAVVRDPSRTAASRMQRLADVLTAMSPGSAGLPLGSINRVQAVVQRLPRQTDPDLAMKYLEFATQPPLPSRLRQSGASDVDHAC